MNARAAVIKDCTVRPLGRSSTQADWRQAVGSSDAGLHLAGVTRSPHPREFWSGNVGTTEAVAAAVRQLGRPLPILYASSIRAAEPTLYGRTKKAAEDLLLDLARETGSPVTILRLPSFFGAWSRPNYNSAVATFCHDVARGLTLDVRMPEAAISLVHLDAVASEIAAWVRSPRLQSGFCDVTPTYASTVGRVAAIIETFGSGGTPNLDQAERGLVLGLWQTYRSHQSRIDEPVVAPHEHSIPTEEEA